jgi:transcriptional regulator with XRE-family HTH domain
MLLSMYQYRRKNSMKTTTSARLKEVMRLYNLRQIDILKKAEPYCKELGIKMGRNDLSQYVSGKVLPGQEKLTALSQALNVSETWLMGYDVPMNATDWTQYDENCIGKEASDDTLAKIAQNVEKFHGNQKRLIDNYNQLSDTNKKKVVNYSDNLLAIQKMEEEQYHLMPDAAHERTDIDTEELSAKHDDDIMDDPNF